MKVRWRHRPSGHDINCQQAMALVAAYLDNALSAVDRGRLEAHLRDCEHCGEHLKQLEVTMLVTGELRAEVLDPLARADLMNLYRRWREDTPTD